MVSRTCFNRKSSVLLILIVSTVVVTGLSGCAKKTVKTDTIYSNELPVPEIVGRPGLENRPPDSRMIASHNLVLEGYDLLVKGDFDNSIRQLERAVGINPSDGPGYYYLAEAWFWKKDFKLAKQFNQLAIIYLRANQQWKDRVEFQKKRIEELMNNSTLP